MYVLMESLAYLHFVIARVLFQRGFMRTPLDRIANNHTTGFFEGWQYNVT